MFETAFKTKSLSGDEMFSKSDETVACLYAYVLFVLKGL